MIATNPQKKVEQSIRIRFPETYSLLEHLPSLQEKNAHIALCIENENLLVATEHVFSFEDYGNISLKLPGLSWKMFQDLHALNEELNFEFDDTEEVWIRMGVFRLIGKLTAKILTSLVNWASSSKKGEVYADPTEYELDHPRENGKKIRRIPDVSYISFSKADEETQNSWDGFIPIPPNMAIEIVSAKKGLKQDLKKMEEIWMPTGVDVGIVICPFTETIYVFEKGNSGHTTQSIFSPFTHPLLPGYSDTFGNYLNKKSA